jgi:hypothetical protein
MTNIKFAPILMLLSFFCMGMEPSPPKPPADTTPPQVSITAPSNNVTVSGIVNIQAQATDNKGIYKVEFYVDNGLKSTIASLPYAYSWDTAFDTNAAHTLKVIAYDASNNKSSAQANVTVNNTASPSGSELTVSSITASGSNAAHPPSGAIDKNSSTYWQGN